jgi:hypothetical protein
MKPALDIPSSSAVHPFAHSKNLITVIPSPLLQTGLNNDDDFLSEVRSSTQKNFILSLALATFGLSLKFRTNYVPPMYVRTKKDKLPSGGVGLLSGGLARFLTLLRTISAPYSLMIYGSVITLDLGKASR